MRKFVYLDMKAIAFPCPLRILGLLILQLGFMGYLGTIPNAFAEMNDSSLLPKAEKGDVVAQLMASENYYHSWGGEKKNVAEAYFWASICGYSDRSTEIPSEKEREKESNEAILRQDMSAILQMMQQGREITARKECQHHVETIRKELSPEQISSLDLRISEWKKSHPPAITKAADKNAVELGWRLYREALGTPYDMRGINALIQKGAQVDVWDEHGTTTLMAASKLGRLEVVDALIKAGADVDRTGDKGFSALGMASAAGNLDIVKSLLRAGASVNGTDEFKSTALLEAVKTDHADVAIALIRAGANKEAENSLGKTPLMMAAEKGYTDVVKALLENGADINAVGTSRHNGKKNALAHAIMNQRLETAKILAAAGAKSALPLPQNDAGPACNKDGKACSNGQTVYRTGPKCAFAACPPTIAKPTIPGNELSDRALQVFGKGGVEEKEKLIQQIESAPQNYSPPALNALAHALFHQNKDDEGAFWYMAAAFRAHYDGLICPPKGYMYSRSEAGESSLEMGDRPEYGPYARKNPEKIKTIIAQVEDWDRKTPYNYNHRWRAKAGECLSESRWESLKEDSRVTYAEELVPPAKTLEKIVLLIGKNNVEQEIDVLKPLAESGDIAAQYRLGYCYLSKTCTPPAADIQRMEADRKRQEAEQMGAMSIHYTTLDIYKDYPVLAVKWLTAAANGGSKLAPVTLANEYFMGSRLPKDPDKGRAILLEAGQKGNSAALAALARQYATGRALPANPDMARQRLLKLAQSGYHMAFLDLGDISSLPVERYAWQRLAEDHDVPYARTMRLNTEISLTDEEFSEARKLAEKYHADYFRPDK